MVQFPMGPQQSPSALMHSITLIVYISFMCIYAILHLYIFFSDNRILIVINSTFLQQNIKYSKRATKGSSEVSSAESCLGARQTQVSGENSSSRRTLHLSGLILSEIKKKESRQELVTTAILLSTALPPKTVVCFTHRI